MVDLMCKIKVMRWMVVSRMDWSG